MPKRSPSKSPKKAGRRGRSRSRGPATPKTSPKKVSITISIPHFIATITVDWTQQVAWSFEVARTLEDANALGAAVGDTLASLSQKVAEARHDTDEGRSYAADDAPC